MPNCEHIYLNYPGRHCFRAPAAGDRCAIHSVDDNPTPASTGDPGGSDMAEAILSARTFEGLVWHDVDFSHASATIVTFRHCDLEGASFFRAQFDSVVFESCNLSHSDFSAARLYRCVFQDCQMRNCGLARADLTGTTVRSSSLDASDFSDADFFDVQLSRVSLRTATGLDGPNIHERFGNWPAAVEIRRELLNNAKETGDQRAAAHHNFRMHANRGRDYFAQGVVSRMLIGVGMARRFPGLRSTRRNSNTPRQGSPVWDLRWLANLMLRATTGYGESVLRTALFALLVVVCSAVLYMFLGLDCKPLPGDIGPCGGSVTRRIDWDVGLEARLDVARVASDFGSSLYYSVVTFTTLGYGDCTPASAPARTIAAAEAVLGMLSGALLVYVILHHVER